MVGSAICRKQETSFNFSWVERIYVMFYRHHQKREGIPNFIAKMIYYAKLPASLTAEMKLLGQIAVGNNSIFIIYIYSQ